MQFDRPDDPRATAYAADDCEKLNKRKGILLFAPRAGRRFIRTVTENQTHGMSRAVDHVEGASRPCHLRRRIDHRQALFNPSSRDVACFGEKDFQQPLICKMVADYGLRY